MIMLLQLRAFFTSVRTMRTTHCTCKVGRGMETGLKSQSSNPFGIQGKCGSQGTPPD